MVLNGVVRPARDELGNLGPLVAPLLMCIVNDAVLQRKRIMHIMLFFIYGNKVDRFEKCFALYQLKRF